MKNKENVVDSVVKVTIDHTSESKQDVIQASQKLLHFLSKTTSSNSIVKKHKGKKYCCIAREKHFDSSNVTSSLNVCCGNVSQINNTKNVVEYLSCLPLSLPQKHRICLLTQPEVVTMAKKFVTTLKGCNNGKIKLLPRLKVVTMAK